ncbi:MAG TPA: hypothetical protein V6D22_22990 [Candidatus Obscuribacterales bacterium]
MTEEDNALGTKLVGLLGKSKESALFQKVFAISAAVRVFDLPPMEKQNIGNIV